MMNEGVRMFRSQCHECDVYVPPHISNARNANAKNANTIPSIPNQEVSMLNFEMLFRFWLRVLLDRTTNRINLLLMQIVHQ